MNLNKLFYIKKDIELIESQIESLSELGAMNLDGMPHGNGKSDPVDSLARKRMRLIEKLEKKKNELRDKEIEINDFINSIDDEEISYLARLRYIENLRFEDIGSLVYQDRTTVSKKLRNYCNRKLAEMENGK